MNTLWQQYTVYWMQPLGKNTYQWNHMDGNIVNRWEPRNALHIHVSSKAHLLAIRQQRCKKSVIQQILWTPPSRDISFCSGVGACYSLEVESSIDIVSKTSKICLTKADTDPVIAHQAGYAHSRSNCHWMPTSVPNIVAKWQAEFACKRGQCQFTFPSWPHRGEWPLLMLTQFKPGFNRGGGSKLGVVRQLINYL